jgi:drug/metabolite transporter (DMT)-like permease
MVPFDAVSSRIAPPWWMAAGALAVSTSAIFLDLSGAAPGTATFFRCLVAVPLLLPLVVSERRTDGRPTGRQTGYAVAAGVLFAGDALWWTQAIGEVGAGLSTVLVNAQVVLVPLLAWVFDREPVSRVFIAFLPPLTVGIVLAGGVWGEPVAGSDPVPGTVHALLAALCYSGFLYLLRLGGGRGGAVVQSYQVVVITAALTALAVGRLWGDVDLRPGWTALAWLVLVGAVSQAAGWLLVALASPRLPAEAGAALLLLTPVGSLLLGALALGERPSPLQLLGCGLVLVSAYAVSARPGRRPS